MGSIRVSHPVLIPAMGLSSRFAAEGHSGPKGLLPIEYGGETIPMIRRVIRSIPRGWQAVLIVPEEYHRAFRKATDDQAVCIPVHGVTAGQSETIAMGLQHVDPTGPVAVQNCDVVFDPELYRRMLAPRPLRNTVALHEDRSDDAIFSYVDDVVRPSVFAEKVRISQWAQSGLWLFQKPSTLWEAIQQQRAEGLRHNGELYLSGALNFMESPIQGLVCRSDEWLDLGTPEAVRRAGARIAV